ncbi:MAG: hypothetical protein ABSC23_20685 [Bryobacteraceae bacterium]|jgi:CRISPR type III-A-associated RAMP protein Csm4
MNPGLVVKLRPSGPWRVGSDLGARNRVDALYHSDSLFAAVTSAMARLGSLEEWLDATVRSVPMGRPPAASFSSCFPFMDEIDFIVPPRTIWPPASPGAPSRVRWKSARFAPLSLVQSILAGRKPGEDRWSVDGPSECLVPAGAPGPFRSAVRWSAAVDRVTGATERHSIACLEFRPGAGLWAVVSFADEAARDKWQAPVKAAFRLLADSGFGGERSRGWGRSEPPEFQEGILPDLILPPSAPRQEPGIVGQVPDLPGPVGQVLNLPSEGEAERPSVKEPSPEPPTQEALEQVSNVPGEGEAEPAPAESKSIVADALPVEGSEAEAEPAPIQTEAAVRAPDELEPLLAVPLPPAPETVLAIAEPSAEPAPVAEDSPFISEPAPPAPDPQPLAPALPEPPAPTPAEASRPHWLLSLFTPAPSDTVDFRRGNYTLLTRGGRVESSAASGALKQQLQMVAEGSVLIAPTAPSGSAPDVAPEGLPHPVYRAGFAVAIPLPDPAPSGAPEVK